MSAKLVKVILLLACSLGCVTLNSINLKGDPNSLPVKSLTLTLDVSQRDQYFNQMQKFADKHSLEFHITFFDADKKSFLIEIIGNGFHIDSAAPSNLTKEIGLGLFNDTSTPTPQPTVDELFNDLKNFISEISNAMITEKRKGLIVTIDENQRDELIARMQQLVDRYPLQQALSFSSDKTLFHAEIQGDGFHITGDPLVSPRRTVVVDFWLDYYKSPTPASIEAIDELFSELKSAINEIPNVTIVEDK